jgi:hypothetical protein
LNRAEAIDLTQLANKEVIRFFEELVNSGNVVLHGSNSEQPYVELQARKANDASKESGNKAAVYASTDPYVPLMCAILNKWYIIDKTGGYTFGEYFVNNRKIFKGTPKVQRH